jgi:hypothetical protein
VEERCDGRSLNSSQRLQGLTLSLAGDESTRRFFDLAELCTVCTSLGGTSALHRGHKNLYRNQKILGR